MHCQEGMFAEEVALSTEETDHLVRSTKKQKAASKPFSPQRPILSYKDSVLRLELDNNDPYPTILLSREEKLWTRSPWRSTLIIKAFGKSLGTTKSKLSRNWLGIFTSSTLA